MLIKGRPTKNGRFLYVTTIKGFVEIKPGIKMVFIGDQVYRVVHKGGDKFSGKKIDYRGEDGLKGVFNMKNQGRPSIVLNHNKTPFHWITLKHLDIGTALRAIGSRLFSHELILESKQGDPDTESKSFLLREVTKLITGQVTFLKLIDVETEEGGEDLTDVEDNEGSISNYETVANLILTMNMDKVPDEHHRYFDEIGMFPFDFGFGDLDSDDKELLNAHETDGAVVTISFETDAQVRHSYDQGDHWTPPSGDSEASDIESSLSRDGYNRDSKLDPFLIDDDYAIIPDDLIPDLEIYEKMIEEQDPSEIIGDLKDLVFNKVRKVNGIQRDSKLTQHLRSLYYTYSKSIVDIRKNGISEEAKKKWSRIDQLDLVKIEKQALEIIEKQMEIEAIAKDTEQELTQDQIDISATFFDMIDDMIPKGRTSFKYSKGRGHEHVGIDLMNDQAIKNAVNSLKLNISTPDRVNDTKQRFERELIDINYSKAKHNALGTEYPQGTRKKEERLDFYLNHSDVS
jgi:hypothetical protein